MNETWLKGQCLLHHRGISASATSAFPASFSGESQGPLMTGGVSVGVFSSNMVPMAEGAPAGLVGVSIWMAGATGTGTFC
jgi:hypothetical protein